MCGLHFCKLVISLLLRGTYQTYLDLQVILRFLLAFLNLRLNRFDFFGMSVYQHLLQRDLDIVRDLDIPILHLHLFLLDSRKLLLVLFGLINKLFLKIGYLRLTVSLISVR